MDPLTVTLTQRELTLIIGALGNMRCSTRKSLCDKARARAYEDRDKLVPKLWDCLEANTEKELRF